MGFIDLQCLLFVFICGAYFSVYCGAYFSVYSYYNLITCFIIMLYFCAILGFLVGEFRKKLCFQETSWYQEEMMCVFSVTFGAASAASSIL